MTESKEKEVVKPYLLQSIHKDIDNYCYKTGNYPEKIVVTQAAFARLQYEVFSNKYDFYSALTTNEPARCELFGISCDIIVSNEVYYMIGNPIKPKIESTD
jgi:hypothetical protein